MFTEKLCFAWTGDLTLLKQFVSEKLNLDGSWEQPSGHRKVFKCKDLTIIWKKNKNLLSIEGERAKDIIEHLFKIICSEYSGASSEHSSVSADIQDDIENLKLGQSINGEAIKTLSDSICQLTTTVSYLQNCIKQNKKSPDDIESATSTNRSTEYGNHVHLNNGDESIIYEPVPPNNLRLDTTTCKTTRFENQAHSASNVNKLAGPNFINVHTQSSTIEVQPCFNNQLDQYKLKHKNIFHDKQQQEKHTKVSHDSASLYNRAQNRPITKQLNYNSKNQDSIINRDQRRIPNHYRPNFFPKNFRRGQHRKIRKRNYFNRKVANTITPNQTSNLKQMTSTIIPRQTTNSFPLRSELPVEPQPWDEFLQSINRTLDQYGTWV